MVDLLELWGRKVPYRGGACQSPVRDFKLTTKRSQGGPEHTPQTLPRGFGKFGKAVLKCPGVLSTPKGLSYAIPKGEDAGVIRIGLISDLRVMHPMHVG